MLSIQSALLFSSLLLPSIPPASSPHPTSRRMLSCVQRFLVLLPLPCITLILICLLMLLGDLLRPSGPLPNDGGCEHCLESSVPYLDSKEASYLTSETSLSSHTALVDDLIIGLRDCHPEIRPLQLFRSNL